MIGSATRLELLREQQTLLMRLETIVTEDERVLAAGPAGFDPAREKERQNLLSRLGEVNRTLSSDHESDPAVPPHRPDPSAGRGGQRAGSEQERLRDSNRARVRALEVRTAALLAAWQGRREESVQALTEISNVKRLLGSFGTGRPARSDLDVRR